MLTFVALVIPVSLAAIQQPADRPIPTGLVFIAGNMIQPPYMLTIVDSTLFINGLPLTSFKTRRETPGPSFDSTYKPSHRWPVLRQLRDIALPPSARSIPTTARVSQALTILTSSADIDTAWQDGDCSVAFIWKSDRALETYDLCAFLKEPPRDQLCQALERAITATLKGGGLVAIDSGTVVHVPAVHVRTARAEIDSLRRGKALTTGRPMLPPALHAHMRQPKSMDSLRLIK